MAAVRRNSVTRATKCLARFGSTRTGSAHELAHRIKSLIGITAEVEAIPPGGIERSIGKAKRIVDLRPKD